VRTVRVPVLLRRPLDGADSEGGQQLMPTRILVPLDGSALAETIIDEALAVGELTAAAYTFVQVIAPPITASAEATYEFELEVTAMRRAAHEYLETRAAILRANGHRVSTRTVMQSNVAAAIVEEAIQSECDMIAMATHGRSGLTRIALGSIADKVLRSAAVPMLVMKPDAARTPAQTV
jgi:nucleotide-binding universal stress UspA family protein